MPTPHVRRVVLQACLLVTVGGAGALIHAFVQPVQLRTRPSVAEGRADNYITAADAFALFEVNEAAFVDARSRREYEQGHVPGAFWLPFEVFASGRPASLDYYPDHLPLIVYCDGGDCHAAEQVEEMLHEYGFTLLRILENGWPAWVGANYPRDTGPPMLEP